MTRFWQCKIRGEDADYEPIEAMTAKDAAMMFATKYTLLNGEYVTIKGEGRFKIFAQILFRAQKRSDKL